METNKATFAGGCFWCTEAVFMNLKGVDAIVSGYTGGAIPFPTYEQICGGNTGHAEAVQITFDAHKISFKTLMEVFFATHNPTTLNRQGADIGPQYRSAIFYHNEIQKNEAELLIKSMNEEQIWDKPVVTEINPFTIFYKAEDYHQNYYYRNPDQGYCSYVITPKIDKLYKLFSAIIK